MKQRLTALDGIRGYAALSVMLSHTGFGIEKLTSIPFIIAAYKSFSVGPNSVQIFFVLCGFLMAYLYPTVHDNVTFILKRYSRIFPIFGVVVVFLWLSGDVLPIPWYLHSLLLIGIALACALIWKSTTKISKGILIAFLILQAVAIACANVLFPVLYHSHLPPEPFTAFFKMISNITMTTIFTKDIAGLSGVFWSLTPEVMFYLIYPFFVIPLIQVGRRYGILISVLIILGMTKLLFDLDTALINYQTFISLNIARSAGFIAGVTIGTIYFARGVVWSKMKHIVAHPAFSVLSLVAFFFVQWGDTYIRDGNSRIFMNWYYIASSWVFACVILAAVTENTFLNKIFSWKPFRFLGTISYSLYLTHTIAIDWAHRIFPTVPLAGYAFGIGISIVLAWVLFQIVESLYFKQKKLTAPHMAVESKGDISENHFRFSNVHLIGLAAGFCLLFLVYLGEASPTILVQRHSLATNNVVNPDFSLMQNTLRIPFTASHPNLSIVTVFLRHVGNEDKIKQSGKPLAQLIFRLYEKGKKKPLYESVRDATIVTGSPKFSFGLPPIAESKGKNYVAEVSLSGASQKDYIIAELLERSVTTSYTQTKSDILHSPQTFVFNRLQYVWDNSGAIFGLGFIVFVWILVKNALRIRI